MKRAFTACICALAFAGVLMTSASTAAQQSAAPAPGMAQRPGRMRQEKHPEIRMALRHLRMAKTNLEKGEHDFGGHRAKALELTNQAIKELQDALAYDRK